MCSSDLVEYAVDFVKALGEEARTQGDPARGETVFRGTLTNCVSCHAIGGAGGKVGPDLSAVGTGLPMDMVIESVLWPNRQVKEGFMTTAVITETPPSEATNGGFALRETEDPGGAVKRTSAQAMSAASRRAAPASRFSCAFTAPPVCGPVRERGRRRYPPPWSG